MDAAKSSTRRGAGLFCFTVASRPIHWYKRRHRRSRSPSGADITYGCFAAVTAR